MKLRGFVDEGCWSASLWSGLLPGECGWGLAVTAGFHAVTAREAQGWHGEERR